MSDSVRETLCTKCSHRVVCSYKLKYLDMINNLEKVFYSVPEEFRSNMFFHDPDCKFMESRNDSVTKTIMK